MELYSDPIDQAPLSYLQQAIYSDKGCASLIKAVSLQLGVCIPSAPPANDYVFYTTTSTGNSITLTTSKYTDSACATAAEITHDVIGTTCTGTLAPVAYLTSAPISPVAGTGIVIR